MKDKPKNIHLEGLFFKEGEDCKVQKEKIVHAWLHVHKLENKFSGKTNCVPLEPYFKWVQDRAISLKMPYPRQEPLPLAGKEPTYILMTNSEKLKIALTKVQRERDAWKTSIKSSTMRMKNFKGSWRWRMKKISLTRRWRCKRIYFPLEFSQILLGSWSWTSLWEGWDGRTN